ncbi:MAG: hypothetical protein JOZ81_04925 [Chloroflexi bacterium]|nr:hypothetical protein [Chloroflexota bacterium]
MSKKHRFRVALNPATGQLEWAPSAPGAIQTVISWMVLAASTVAFLAIAGYFVYVFLLSSPRLDITALTDGGPSVMQQGVRQLR